MVEYRNFARNTNFVTFYRAVFESSRYLNMLLIAVIVVGEVGSLGCIANFGAAITNPFQRPLRLQVGNHVDLVTQY